jgi:hypothetical protein
LDFKAYGNYLYTDFKFNDPLGERRLKYAYTQEFEDLKSNTIELIIVPHRENQKILNFTNSSLDVLECFQANNLSHYKLNFEKEAPLS